MACFKNIGGYKLIESDIMSIESVERILPMALTKKEKEELKLFIMETIEQEIKLQMQPINQQIAGLVTEAESVLHGIEEIDKQRIKTYYGEDDNET